MKAFTKPRFLALIAGTAAACLLWSIQVWPKPIRGKNTHYRNAPFPLNESQPLRDVYGLVLWPYRIQIGIILFSFVAISEVAVAFVPLSRRRRRVYTDFINHFINHRFGDFLHYRVTLYRIDYGWKLWPSYVWRCFICNAKQHWHKRLLHHYLRCFPSPGRKYIRFFVRRGQPFSDGTSTIFIVPQCPEEAHGIVPYCTLEPRQVSSGPLPRFDPAAIRTIAKIDDISDPFVKNAVHEHIRKGHLHSFAVLKSLHRIPTFVWAAPLIDADENIWAVLCVDTDVENSALEADPSLPNELVEFSKEIETIHDGLV